MEDIYKILYDKNNPLQESLVAQSASLSYLLNIFRARKQRVVIIGSPEQLQKILRYAQITESLYESKYVIFPAIEHYTKDIGLFQAYTLRALYMLTHENPYLVFIPYTQCLYKFPSPSLFSDNLLEIHRGKEISYNDFLNVLYTYGYRTTTMVHRCTEIAYRGDIVDIYPPDAYCINAKGINEALPLRVEFFGDVIEDIRIFNKESQRFIKRIDSHTLYPIHFGCFSKEKQIEYQKNLPTYSLSIVERIREKSMSIAPPYFYQHTEHTLFDWLPQNAYYMRTDDASFDESLKQAKKSLEQYCASLSEALSLTIEYTMVGLSYDMERCIREKKMIHVESISTKKESIVLHEKTLHTFQEVCPQKEAVQKPWKSLVEQFHVWKGLYKQIILVFKSHSNRDSFIALAQEEGIKGVSEYSLEKQGIFFCIGDIDTGSILIEAQVILIPESLLYPNYRKRKWNRKVFKGLDQLPSLQEGMHIIHKEYGVGIYRGLHRIVLGDTENDYILLEYAHGDKVYIPVYQLGVLQIYSSGEEHVILDSLGSNGWRNSLVKARKSIEKIAHDLVAMYAQRSCSEKHRYGPYTELYREFEMAFGFEETVDQAQAIEDVLEDMDNERPMDRLVCGDVGFGKTEVAIRACVRAALDGRQVVFLCPTTILAEQHYQTIQNRISMLPLRIALLNRFVSKREQKKIIQDISNGSIDIIIGTHRVLSKDIHIPHLSLLILDEEHRFGVRHKEQLRLLRSSIDTLTLTATPIPRTLQLSMSGIRSLSIIETPPLERKAVKSFLCEDGDSQIEEALHRELERKGQVFWVYNRVHTIDERVRYVQKLCPNARIGVVHGQMNEQAIEENMRAFWQGEIDILLATTIIESGLDFPLANTIIIESAHTFGLNQLYQLRGRVGRGERQGYAYFVIPQKRVLTQIAMDRLNAILNLDYLGAGFQLAMEDLRIRGAGNILGEAQSGHIERIGIELYLEMLEEEVNKLRSQDVPKRKERTQDVVLNVALPTYIPESYIIDSKERLFYYKKISMIHTNEEEEDIRLELQDRFGKIPEQVDILLCILTLQRILSKLGVTKVSVCERNVMIEWKEEQDVIEPDSILMWVNSHKNVLSIVPPSSVEYTICGSVAQGLRMCIDRVVELYAINTKDV